MVAHMGGWGGATWALLGVFGGLLVLGALGAALSLGSGRRGAAEAILAERLARGEISPEEHEQRLVSLRRSGGRRPERLAPLAIALAVIGLVGTLIVAGVAPGMGHGFMSHMMGGRGGMMGGQEGRSGSPPAAGAPEVRVVGREFSFEPREMRLRTDETVNVVFDNRGHMFHTLTVGELGLELRVNGGDRIAGALRAERPGRYAFICTVPGHAEAGMRGTITVGPTPSGA